MPRRSYIHKECLQKVLHLNATPWVLHPQKQATKRERREHELNTVQKDCNKQHTQARRTQTQAHRARQHRHEQSRKAHAKQGRAGAGRAGRRERQAHTGAEQGRRAQAKQSRTSTEASRARAARQDRQEQSGHTQEQSKAGERKQSTAGQAQKQAGQAKQGRHNKSRAGTHTSRAKQANTQAGTKTMHAVQRLNITNHRPPPLAYPRVMSAICSAAPSGESNAAQVIHNQRRTGDPSAIVSSAHRHRTRPFREPYR